MKLIINADDYGLSPYVSDAILESIRNGFITQTTVMTNMPDCERAIEAAQKAGVAHCIGLHLNLTQGTPLTDGIKGVSLFCDTQGRFCNDNGELLRDAMYGRGCYGRISPQTEQAVAMELEAQACRFLEMGLTMLHFDGHHHIHMDPMIGRIALPLLAKYGFESYRAPSTMWLRKHRFPILHPRGWCKATREKLFYKKLSLAACFYHADEFSSLDTFSRERKLLDESSTVELMAHPRYYDGRLVNVVNWEDGSGRDVEVDFRSAVRDSDQLITYSNLQS